MVGVTPVSFRRRLASLLTGREAVPEQFTGTLDAAERVLADAAAPRGYVVLATDVGLWLDDHRIPWHLVSKATWQAGALEVVEATEVLGPDELPGGVVVLADRPVRRVPLVVPGRVPETVHRRVTGSIRAREHVDVPSGGGVWFVQRRVGGRVLTQVRPDPGTDPDAVRVLAEGVGERLAGGS